MKKKLLLAAIVVLGMFLRGQVIKWGLPDKEHFCLFDSDEYTAIMLLEHMEPKKLNFFPYYPYAKMFPDPVFHYYVVGAAEMVASKLGYVVITKDKGFYLNHPDIYARLFIVGRLLSFVMGLLTIILVYVFGKSMYGEATGLLAAFFLSIMPLHVVYAAVLNVAEPVAMWLALTACFTVMLYKTKQLKWYVLAGASAGLALGTKYTAFPVLLMMLVAHTLSEKKIVLNKNIILSFAAMLAAFFVFNPYYIIKLPLFVDSFVEHINWLVLRQNMPAVVHRDYLAPLTPLLNHAMGFPLLAAALLGIILALIKRTDYDLMLLSWALVYYFLSAHSGLYFVRYQTEQLPFLAVFAARFLVYLHGTARRAAVLLAIIAAAVTLTLTLATIKQLKSDFPRTTASRWIISNIKDGSSIGTVAIPYEYHPPVIFMQYHHEARYKEAPMERPFYSITNIGYEPSGMQKLSPDYMVLTGSEYYQNYKVLPRGAEFMDMLNSKYELVKKFEIAPEIFGIKFKDIEYPAWIMNYDRVFIFKKKLGS